MWRFKSFYKNNVLDILGIDQIFIENIPEYVIFVLFGIIWAIPKILKIHKCYT